MSRRPVRSIPCACALLGVLIAGNSARAATIGPAENGDFSFGDTTGWVIQQAGAAPSFVYEDAGPPRKGALRSNASLGGMDYAHTAYHATKAETSLDGCIRFRINSLYAGGGSFGVSFLADPVHDGGGIPSIGANWDDAGLPTLVAPETPTATGPPDSSVAWEDAVALAGACCYRPFGKCTYQDQEWVIQLGPDQKLIGTSTTGHRPLPSPTYVVRRIWQVSGPTGTRMIAQTSRDATHMYIETAADIGSPWSVSLSLGDINGTLERSIIDFGGGRILLITYGDNDKQTFAYYSVDGGQTWGSDYPSHDDGTPVFVLNGYYIGGAIRHIHGGVWDEANGILYIFTGDQTYSIYDHASILVCDDVFGENGLLRNPPIWMERWALRNTDRGRREAQLRANPQYSVVVDGVRALTQGLRTVDLALADPTWAVWIDDRGSGETGEQTASHVYRMNRQTRQTFEMGRVVGTGRPSLKTTTGDVVWATESVYYNTSYRIGHDGYVRLYYLNPATAEVRELRRWQRADAGHEVAGSSASWYGLWEVGGHVWGGLTAPAGRFRTLGIAGRLVHYAPDGTRMDEPIDPGWAAMAQRVMVNLLASPQLPGWPSTWWANASMAPWPEMDNAQACPYMQGLTAWKVGPRATGAHSYAYTYTTTSQLPQVQAGNWLCYYAWVKLPSPRPYAGYPQYTRAVLSGPPGVYGTYDFPGWWYDGSWQLTRVTCFQPAGLNGQTQASIWAHQGWLNAAYEPVWFAGASLVVGTEPVVATSDDAKRGYVVEFTRRADNVRIALHRKADACQSTLLATYMTTMTALGNDWHTLRIHTSAGQIQVRLDATDILSVSEGPNYLPAVYPDHYAGGAYWGVYTDQRANWADVSFDDLAVGNTLEPITDLTAQAADWFQVNLFWTAPGDFAGNQVASYDARYSTSPIYENNWDAATPCAGEPAGGTPGQSRTFAITGLEADTRYYFAIKAIDQGGNTSGLSNVATATTWPRDIVAPAPITDLTFRDLRGTRVTLSWTATGDDQTVGRADRYDVRYSTDPIDEGNWTGATEAAGEPAPQPAGATETFVLRGLQGETTYYLAVRAIDEASNASALSNVVTFQTPPADRTPPTAISDLRVERRHVQWVTLAWTAPADAGDAGIGQYDLRRSPWPIDAANWSAATRIANLPAPSLPGATERFTVTDLQPGTQYYFAVKTSDDADPPNISELSNVVAAATFVPDGVAPATVADLHATTSSQSGAIDLTWTASGDDGNTGQAAEYEIRYSSDPLTPGNFGGAALVSGVPAPQLAGTPEQLTILGLQSGQRYYFAVRVADELGNISSVSNVTHAKASGLGEQTLQAGLMAYTGCQDGYIEAINPLANFGRFSRMWVHGFANHLPDQPQRGLIRFDLASIPGDATIRSAKLCLYTADPAGVYGSQGSYCLHRITRTWGEINSSWLYAADATPWNTPGGDFESAPDATSPKQAVAGVWYQFDVTARVQEWIRNPAGNHGWLIKVDDETLGDQDLFCQSDAPEAACRPKLVISDLVPPLVGDVDDDGCVTIFDVIDTITTFGSVPGNPMWNPGADFDADGCVTIFDVVDCIIGFGTCRQ